MKPTPILNATNHLQQLERLLQLEYTYEKEQFRQQSEAVGIARKVKQGLCWYPLSVGRSYYNSLNQFVVEVSRSVEIEMEHEFEYGRTVCFFTQNSSGQLHYYNFLAQVSYTDNNRMVISLPHASHLAELQNAAQLGVQLYFDETSYRTMFDALSATMRAKEGRLATLRDRLYGTQPLTCHTPYPVRFPWLNASQEGAVNKVLYAKEVAIIHGPPGTGKTTTLVEAVYETLHRESQVLVCAQSNMAVDWIAEKLTDRGISVLRLGNPTRVNDKMLANTYEHKFAAHPLYDELWSIRKTVRDIQSQHRKGGNREEARNRIAKLKERATELEIAINEALFSEARVVASTLIGSAHRLLMGRHFDTLFVDEAAQALEAATWVAMAKAKRVVLAGDHCQLPPTIKCIEAMRGGLDSTLMQQVATRQPEAVSMLTVQYRMNEAIVRFPSRWFYNDQLQAAPEAKYRGILAYDTPLVWYDTAACQCGESYVGESFGRINKGEALLLLAQLEEYIAKIGIERVLEERIDIGVISPYKNQVRYLRQQLQRTKFFAPLRSLITVNTVDGFQGQERDVIFISMVRANNEGNIGFLSDLRRMNVAITRARMKLVLLGDASTLTRSSFFQQLYTYIEQEGVVIPLTDEV